MKTHANARLTVRGRLLLCERVTHQGWTVAAAAEAAGISTRRAYTWLARFRAERVRGLSDRSSARTRVPAARRLTAWPRSSVCGGYG